MRRREVVWLLCGAGVLPLTARAETPAKPRRIGYLSPGSRDVPVVRRALDAFRQGLLDAGYIDGQNITVEYRFAAGDFKRLPQLAAELVRLNVEIIVAGPSPVAVAASKATSSIPIVMMNVGDPVGLGLVAKLSRPGGNVTGLSYSVGLETLVKGLELLKDTLPDLRSVAVLSNPANPAHALVESNVAAGARTLAVQLQLLEARGPHEFEAAFAAMAEWNAGAVIVVPDFQSVTHAARLADLALAYRLPSIYGFRENVEAGGLMSYGPDFADSFRRAATFVDKLLKGASPADLPVEQPTKFELVINLRTAKALGLGLSPILLARADEVIE